SRTGSSATTPPSGTSGLPAASPSPHVSRRLPASRRPCNASRTRTSAIEARSSPSHGARRGSARPARTAPTSFIKARPGVRRRPHDASSSPPADRQSSGGHSSGRFPHARYFGNDQRRCRSARQQRDRTSRRRAHLPFQWKGRGRHDVRLPRPRRIPGGGVERAPPGVGSRALTLPNPRSAGAPMSPPTHARYRVVALATGLGMITYLDRACISTLSPGITRDLALSTVQMGYVFTVFQLAYALFEIPTAWWADRRGTRSVLTRIVIWWSCLTAATGAAFSYPVLLVVRFLFGMGEAGAWPCVARTFSRWIPRRERGTVQGVFFAGAHMVGGLTPALVLWLLRYLSWREIFVCFGTVG